VLRTTRTTVSVKENENANAGRTSRLVARGKTLAAGGATDKIAASGTTGLHRTTFSSRAKALESAATSSKIVGGDDKQLSVKRKREAFGEVGGANKNTRPTVKGKEKENTAKEYDGVVLKAKPVSSRAPLRTVASKPIARKDAKEAGEAAASKVKTEKKTAAARPTKTRDEHAMTIDHPSNAPAPADAIPSLTVRRSLLMKDQESKVIPPKRAEASARAQRARREVERDDEEEERVFKKRRTSSDAPEPEPHVEEEDPEAALAARLEAEMEAFANEVEFDPEHGGWDDLDAEDDGDPLMVSEYVVEIFNYMRQLEVSFFTPSISTDLLTFTKAPNDAQSQLHGEPEGVGLEDARYPD
jgi:G2/mitotic-specific cyclin 1/2